MTPHACHHFVAIVFAATVLLQYHGLVATASLFPAPWCTLAVTSGYRERSKDTSRTVEYDEFGGLPQLENTYRAIGRASTIVAIRTGDNATVVSYLGTKQSAIQLPIGAQLLNNLINPYQHLLITGLAGDARLITRYARQVVLNHTVAFEAAPSGTHIANKIGSLLLEYTVRGGTRPLAVHCFVVDGLVERSLHEIDAAGNVAQVWAGVAGTHMRKGMDILVSHLNGSAVDSVDVAKDLASSILQLAVDSKAKEEDDDDATSPKSGESSSSNNTQPSTSTNDTMTAENGTMSSNSDQNSSSTTSTTSSDSRSSNAIHIVLPDRI
jgi:20S proteasome alpha/beta subunit